MSVEGFQVRIAGVKDLAGVIALERAVAEAPHWVEAEYAAIAGMQGRGIRRCLFIAEIDNCLVGFAVGKVIGAGAASLAELESVAVSAAARRNGVGRALCGAVADWSREQGAESIELEVRATSAGAIALYAGLGFSVAGRRRGYYREPVDDAVLMRLELERGK
jgi:[ribosomal protein S18]-alanine N-acetyltransferase